MNSHNVLDIVNAPNDLKSLSLPDLENLCAALRSYLIEAVSEIGGHFASSLGVVELTVALHYAFDTPHDRIVWDVGHQSYIHKMLTGRKEGIKRVKHFGGLSGFPSREESEFDSFGVGHAGTAISAGLGMLEASSHPFPGTAERNVVCVVGDGGMTCGMSFEALNHAGHLQRKLIVVLNDNEMSIAPNVGAISLALSRAITGRVSNLARRNFKSLYGRGYIPEALYKVLDKAEEATQGFLSTPAMLFNAFGFRYFGPVDGHDIPALLDAFSRAKEQDGPVLIHAVTTKGKGYEPAETDPVKFHGVTPFTVENGQFKKRGKKSFSNVFGEALVEHAEKDPRIVGITAAMPDGTGLQMLADKLPERFFDTAITEQHAVTFAAGLACEGMRPVCAIYSTFLQRAYDQVLHDVCLQNLPVIFAIDRAGIVGGDGAAFHGVFDISFLRSIPNLVLMAPHDETELRDMLATAVNYEDGPIAFRFPRGDAQDLDSVPEAKTLPIGKGEIVREPNFSRCALLALGQPVSFAKEAAAILANEYGIEVTVANARFAKPLDGELIKHLALNNNLLITIEDHCIVGGFGSAVLEFMADNNLLPRTKVVRLGVPNSYIPHGAPAELYRLCGFDVSGIVKATLDNLGVCSFPKVANV